MTHTPHVDTQHTPGPWVVVDGHWLKPVGKTRIVGTILDFDGCMVYRDGYTAEEMDAEVEANKRLVAAAPELLDALRYFVRWYDQLQPDDIEKVVATIKKATGSA